MPTKAVAKRNANVEENSVVAWKPMTLTSDDLTEVMEAMDTGNGFGPRELESIRMPAAGQTIWAIPTADGRGGGPYFDAVVLHYHTQRLFWAKPYGSGQPGPPNCESVDGLRGMGDPGGVCAKCPFNRVRENRDEILCPPRKLLFVLLPDMPLPVVVNLPVTSMRPWDDYVRERANRMELPWRVVTRFELTRAQARMGEPYAKLVVSKVSDIPADEQEWVIAYRKAFKDQLEAAYEVKRQRATEMEVGSGGAPWGETQTPLIDDDDLPEHGDGDLPPTEDQKEYIHQLLMETGEYEPEAAADRVEEIETRREASELIASLVS